MKYSTGSINNSSSDVLRKLYDRICNDKLGCGMLCGFVTGNLYDMNKFKQMFFNENVDKIEDLNKRLWVKESCMYCVLKKIYDIQHKILDEVKKNPEQYCVFRKNKQAYMKLIRTLGLIREQKIEKLLRNSFPEYQGYTVRHWNKEDEPDFIVYKDNVPFMVVEVKNYNEKSFMLESTYQNIIKRLSKYNCLKLLILSSGYNLIRKTIQKHNNKHYIYYNTNLRKTSEELRSRGIYTWILGYQDLMSMQDLDDIVKFVKDKKDLEKLERGWIE
ncbi:MAG: hypothetical protein ACP5PT_06820 [Brevinematia bacterium]